MNNFQSSPFVLSQVEGLREGFSANCYEILNWQPIFASPQPRSPCWTKVQ